MNRFFLQTEVLRDLEEIYSYIADFNPHAAWKVMDAAFETFQTLADSPLLGTRYRGTRLAELRFLPLKNYRTYLVFYKPFRDGVLIVHVFHGARDLNVLLK